MRLARLIQRMVFYPIKTLISVIEPFSTNYYLALYTNTLRYVGCNIIGKPAYIHKTVKFDDFNKITLGNNIVISFGVYFLTHDYSRLVAYDFLRNSLGGGDLDLRTIDNPLIGEISVGENSFIGCRSLILPNTKIGKNCIIGAGSVIKGEIPDNSVIIGNPAKIIGSIDDIGLKWLNSHNIKLNNVEEAPSD